MPEDLKTYMGEPTEPHAVAGIEIITVVCNQCGWEVEGDDGAWWHINPKYEKQDDPSDD